MAKINMVTALNAALHEMMETDDTVVILGEDVGVNGGVFRVTDGLYDKYGRKRVVDTPIAESAILGSAIGMAMAGLKPVVEMQFSGFSYQMMHQLEGNASRMRTRSRGRFTVPLVVRMPYGGGVRALEHHSESKEVYWAHTAGVKVVIPSSPATPGLCSKPLSGILTRLCLWNPNGHTARSRKTWRQWPQILPSEKPGYWSREKTSP